ncbi:hypothetical protein [Streptomyces halobius]|uniref:Uncharacterized protein n=1 Tax=Streptomyces halobius TaxID=2879846 RepID=A0ABY4M1I0_9ACTN|nr:hypothetical protein [Streptomyces halobius]UQA91611.1 hypothetical protein K9S39_06845 [Streptomyces halobius]
MSLALAALTLALLLTHLATQSVAFLVLERSSEEGEREDAAQRGLVLDELEPHERPEEED